MSEFEKEELYTRLAGMAEEEQKIAAQTLPDKVLWSEIYRRYTERGEKVKRVQETVLEG